MGDVTWSGCLPHLPGLPDALLDSRLLLGSRVKEIGQLHSTTLTALTRLSLQSTTGIIRLWFSVKKDAFALLMSVLNE